MKVDVIKTLTGWAPYCAKSKAYHKKFNVGDFYHFNIKHYQDQRVKKHLEKYWVMIGLITENQEIYRTKEDLHEDIKWALDITEVHQNMITGEMIKKVGSVAIDKMNQEQFDRFYSDAINVIAKHVIKGITPEEIENQVLELFRFA